MPSNLECALCVAHVVAGCRNELEPHSQLQIRLGAKPHEIASLSQIGIVGGVMLQYSVTGDQVTQLGVAASESDSSICNVAASESDSNSGNGGSADIAKQTTGMRLI